MTLISIIILFICGLIGLVKRDWWLLMALSGFFLLGVPAWTFPIIMFLSLKNPPEPKKTEIASALEELAKR